MKSNLNFWENTGMVKFVNVNLKHIPIIIYFFFF